MTRFDGKTVIVTGAASGIGAASARRFAVEGASVVIADIDDVPGAAVASDICATGGVAHYLHCDVSSSRDWESLADATIERFGRLDVVHNNAFATVTSPTRDLSERDWQRTLDVCLTQIFLCTKACIDHLLEARGAIVNTSSVHALQSFRGYAAYDAAKAGVCALTRNLALEYGPAVRVNAVLPGPILTPVWDDKTPEHVQSVTRQTALDRLGRPEEVAAAVCFLASEDASYITGANLVVDGGMTISSLAVAQS